MSRKTKTPGGGNDGAATGLPALTPPQPRARARGNGTSEPVVFTPAKVAAICARHAEGVFLKHACGMEGVSYDGLVSARERDPAVRLAIEAAHAKGVELLRQRKDSAMPGEDDWKKYSWDLERFDRVEFAPPRQQVDAAVKVDVLTPETAAMIAAVVKAGGE